MSNPFAPPEPEHRARPVLCRDQGPATDCPRPHVCYLYRGHAAAEHHAKHCGHAWA